MEVSEILKIVRQYLYDIDKQMWSDEELINFIDNSVKSYSVDSQAFHAIFNFMPDEYGVYHYPNDFICFNVAWNKDGQNILATSSKELEYYHNLNEKGIAQFIFDDLSSNGEYMLAPNSLDIQDLQISENIDGYEGFINDHTIYGSIKSEQVYSFDSDYGVISPDLGVAIDDFGVVIALADYQFSGDVGVCYDDLGVIDGDLGVIDKLYIYNFVGDCMYSRFARIDEVTDYMALVFNAVSQAYNSDSDFTDPNKALFFKQKYDLRIARFEQIKHKNIGKTQTTNFF